MSLIHRLRDHSPSVCRDVEPMRTSVAAPPVPVTWPVAIWRMLAIGVLLTAVVPLGVVTVVAGSLAGAGLVDWWVVWLVAVLFALRYALG